MSGHSTCPDCGTKLRIRDHTFIGRRVNCPECQTPLRIMASDKRGDYVVRSITAEELARQERRRDGTRKPDKIFVSEPVRRSLLHHLLESPLTVAWLLAIAILILVAVIALAPKHRFAPAPTEQQPQESGAPVNQPDEVISDPRENMDSPSETPGESLPVAIVPVAAETQASTVSALTPVNIDHPLSDPARATSPNVNPEAEEESPVVPARIDVEGKLTQKILIYKQAKPVSRRDLMEAMQEHLGAPILYDDHDLGAEALDKKVTFELENTTVGGVIKSIADAAGWTMEIEETGLRLTRQGITKN